MDYSTKERTTLKRYGLIGFPLTHSFSVSYFTRKFEQEGIEAVYQNFPLEDISAFEKLVKEEPDLRGLNVTVPYKEQIIPFLDALSETARSIRAVNTVCLCRKAGRLALVGHNSDVIGFEKSIGEHLKDHHNQALVLGTGGSSKAVTYVLEKLGISFYLVSRSDGEGRLTYDDIDHKLLTSCPLIINTTPLGMYPKLENYPPIPYQWLGEHHLLFDLIYNPEKTRFLAKGEAQGATIVNGYNMLVYQAEGSWEMWNRKS
jgi:shikimate dehydrogenase